MQIRRLLPHHLKQIGFSGKVWSLYNVPKLTAIPLFIAHRPLLLPLPRSPPSTYPGLFTRSKDPLSEPLDPMLVLPDDAVFVALETFREAEAFLVLFNGTFVAVYSKNANYECH